MSSPSIHSHFFLLPACEGVAFLPADNLKADFEAPFFGLVKLIVMHLAQQPIGLSRLSLYIGRYSQIFISFTVFILNSFE